MQSRNAVRAAKAWEGLENDLSLPEPRRATRCWPWSKLRRAYEFSRSYQRSTRRARKVFHRLGRPSAFLVSFDLSNELVGIETSYRTVY